VRSVYWSIGPSDWTPRLEAMKEQAEQEEMNREMELRRGFWTG